MLLISGGIGISSSDEQLVKPIAAPATIIAAPIPLPTPVKQRAPPPTTRAPDTNAPALSFAKATVLSHQLCSSSFGACFFWVSLYCILPSLLLPLFTSTKSPICASPDEKALFNASAS